jgi:hypothetical protein
MSSAEGATYLATWLAFTPCARAITATDAPGTNVSSTICLRSSLEPHQLREASRSDACAVKRRWSDACTRPKTILAFLKLLCREPFPEISVFQHSAINAQHRQALCFKVTMPERKAKAAFVEPMLLLRTEKLPESDDFQYEILCGRFRSRFSRLLVGHYDRGSSRRGRCDCGASPAYLQSDPAEVACLTWAERSGQIRCR